MILESCKNTIHTCHTEFCGCHEDALLGPHPIEKGAFQTGSSTWLGVEEPPLLVSASLKIMAGKCEALANKI